MSVRDALERATRGLLAVRGQRAPVIVPVRFWYDGASAWISTAADTPAVTGLLRETACVLWVPAVDLEDGGVVARGRARVYSLRDPRGLLLHAPTITAVMSVLALRSASTVVGQARDAARVPTRLLPTGRVVVRVSLGEVHEAVPPPVGPGVAPALPNVVPADVRRAVAGQRHVVVAARDGDDLVVLPATWSGRFALTLPESTALPVAVPAAAALDTGGTRPSEGLGLALSGTLAPGGTLQPERVAWWHGLSLATAELPPERVPRAFGAVVLPD